MRLGLLNITMGVLAVTFVAAASTASGAPQTQMRFGPVPEDERQILMELFVATKGDGWANHSGWGTTASVCDWYGVWCDFTEGDPQRPVVKGLSLADDNLRGELPVTLGNLKHLDSLDVALNHLSGRVPAQLLRRWDDHQFEFNGAGNAFSDFVIRASIEYTASGVLCSEHEDVRYRVDVDEPKGRATFESVRCADAARSRQTYCLVREGTPGSLGRLSRALNALGFATFDSKYDQQFTFTTHSVFVTTTAVWGDGATKTVETYHREGPRDVWTAQELFLALVREISWDRERRTDKCSFEP